MTEIWKDGRCAGVSHTGSDMGENSGGEMRQEDINEVISKSCSDWLSWQIERTEKNGLYEDRYFELLYAVSKKYPGETRHQTALRILRAADVHDPGQAAKEQKNG